MQILTSEVSTRPWVSFDAGPKTVRCPLVFLPPVCGRADCFYKQLIALSAKGYRVIAVRLYFAALYRSRRNKLSPIFALGGVTLDVRHALLRVET